MILVLLFFEFLGGGCGGIDLIERRGEMVN